LYQYLIRPILFLFDPEKVHLFAVRSLSFAYHIPGVNDLLRYIFTVKHASLKREVLGLTFDNPVGLAAGFDKDAEMIDLLEPFGFGSIEIGTLTPKPQPGNEKPRLFRLKEDQALINRMGFNNGGVSEAVVRLKARKSNVIVGGNIGKNKITDNDLALNDYEYAFEALFAVVDYFVVNVSSPNTPNLRELQNKEPLSLLLSRLQERNNEKAKRKPILLKIAPDLTDGQLQEIVEIVQETKIDGIIATNTTISREGLVTETQKVEEIGDGGLSGKPLTARSTEVIKFLRSSLGQDSCIIGVGGIMTANDAVEKLEAGANLIQIYSGFIYNGPSFVKNINKAVLNAGL
jgi:dihydroorotate dehydrogenase